MKIFKKKTIFKLQNLFKYFYKYLLFGRILVDLLVFRFGRNGKTLIIGLELWISRMEKVPII